MKKKEEEKKKNKCPVGWQVLKKSSIYFIIEIP
jgi:hypothetical protein